MALMTQNVLLTKLTCRPRGASLPVPSPSCMDDCIYTSKDGTRGRVCDATCDDGVPYGTLGCGAKSGIYGPHCRACYNDEDKARKQDSPDNRAIM